MSKPLTLAGVVPIVVLLACSDGSTAPASTNHAVLPIEVPRDVLARGAVVAQEICARCHGPDFAGMRSEALTCPGLQVVLDYSFADFDALLTQGMDVRGDLANPMNTVAPNLPTDDRWAVYQYLRSKYGK